MTSAPTASMTSTAIMWFRRDLRLFDQPPLLDLSGETLALYVVDPVLWDGASPRRRAYLAHALTTLNQQLDGNLRVEYGTPLEVLRGICAELGNATVRTAQEFTPYALRRDTAIADQLTVQQYGSPYAVSPGVLATKSGTPFKVFTPFSKAWQERGWHSPADTGVNSATWISPDAKGLPAPLRDLTHEPLPMPVGEEATLELWQKFLEDKVDDYAAQRNRPDRPGTSYLSTGLKWGHIHPRTILADLAGKHSPGAQTFRNEICWRDFYADVLYHRPDTIKAPYQEKYTHLRVRTDAAARADFRTWQAGRTGFPIVDAGMRQLQETGWMHNRLRMITASFLTKDLHLPWQWGAQYFMEQLFDADVASNQHGWQWTAGVGTDAAPYFRVLSPKAQAEKFDPDGAFVRRWIPELFNENYPPPMVDHKNERAETLVRYQEVT